MLLFHNYTDPSDPSLFYSPTIKCVTKSIWALRLISFFLSITLTDIRHPEELSLLRPIEHKKKKKDKGSAEEVYDLTEVPLSSGTLTQLHLDFTYFIT